MKTSKNELVNVVAQAWTLAAAGVYIAHVVNTKTSSRIKFIVN